MSEAILVALITGACAIVANIIVGRTTQDKVMSELHVQNEVQNERIKHLTDEVRKHNSFAERIPTLEGDVKLIEEKIKVANHRLDDLERKTNN